MFHHEIITGWTQLKIPARITCIFFQATPTAIIFCDVAAILISDEMG